MTHAILALASAFLSKVNLTSYVDGKCNCLKAAFLVLHVVVGEVNTTMKFVSKALLQNIVQQERLVLVLSRLISLVPFWFLKLQSFSFCPFKRIL